MLGQYKDEVGVALADGRLAVAGQDGVVVVEAGVRDAARLLQSTAVAAHDAKALRLGRAPADDTLIGAVPRRSGARRATSSTTSRASTGSSSCPIRPPRRRRRRSSRRAEAARRLAPQLRGRLREWGMERLYDEIELPLTAVLADMEDAGIRIDTYRMGEITARLAERVEELEASALELAGEEFQLGSTQQLARILFEKLGLTAGRKGKTGYSTDTRVLRAIRDDHPIVPVVEEWRELTKLLNTYLLPLPELIDERDGRLHTTINQAVAATGRLSTTNPNLQSIPIRTELGRRIRSAFVAADGTRLLSADYSQVELRILAHVSGEPVLREAFARGEDIHAATASQVFAIPQAELSRGQRDTAKMVNFGIIYGISSFGLSENLGIPREEAQELIDTYLARLPRVQELIKRTIAQAAADGYVTTLLGRRRPIPELRASNRQTRSLGERLAVNTVMQGTAADVIKVAMVRIHERLRAEGRAARLVLQVHDELLLEVPEVETSAVRDLVREEMVGAYPLDPALAVEVGVGDTWADAKELERLLPLWKSARRSFAAGRARCARRIERAGRCTRRRGRRSSARRRSAPRGRADQLGADGPTVDRGPSARSRASRRRARPWRREDGPGAPARSGRSARTGRSRGCTSPGPRGAERRAGGPRRRRPRADRRELAPVPDPARPRRESRACDRSAERRSDRIRPPWRETRPCRSATGSGARRPAARASHRSRAERSGTTCCARRPRHRPSGSLRTAELTGPGSPTTAERAGSRRSSSTARPRRRGSPPRSSSSSTHATRRAPIPRRTPPNLPRLPRIPSRRSAASSVVSTHAPSS